MSTHTRPSRAVSRNGNIGTTSVFGVRPDRIDHEVEFVGTVDLARYAIGHVGPDELGFGEVIEPVNALRCVWQLHLAHFGSLIWPTPLFSL
jgi:hypothetical protein